MTTCADLIGAARRHLDAGGQPQLDVLAGTVSATATTIPLTYKTAQAGQILAVDLEVMYVWSVDTTAKTATVRRGVNGSTAAVHTSGALVYVNPRFTDWEIFYGLNADLAALSSPVNGLYQIRTLDLTARSGVEGYDFNATGFLSVADIRWQRPGTVTNEWPEVTDFTVSTNLPTATFPSGNAIFLGGMLPAAQQDIRVRYRAAFTPLTSLADDVTAVTGLPASAVDIPPMGAALTVMAGRPVRRADLTSQGDTRRADEVHVGDVISSTAVLRANRAQRIVEEAARLGQQWNVKTRARVNV